jgi:DNA (cytosine-5)-methyltransferase 1
MNVDSTETTARVLSLCTGYGGIERGLELAGIRHRTVSHVEIEAFQSANLVAKMEEGDMVPAPVWTNVKTFPVEHFRGKVDILTGGYPCQPFSQAGKGLGEEDPRHLWPHILRIIDGVMPSVCLFENVEGHINRGLQTVLSDLESRGYQATWGIFSASEVGAPHQRKRMFILAKLADSPNFGCRRWSRGNGDGFERLQVETEEFGSVVRSEAERCSRESRGSKVDNTERSGLEGHSGNGNSSQGWQNEDRSATQTGVRWPAGPDGDQYEWEPARVTIKSGLCRDSYGPSSGLDTTAPNRVERIRSLGNGVVPQCAAKAVMVMMEELYDQR